MMSLLRTALIASVALALLPTFAPRQDSTVSADIAAADAVTAASATFSDLSGLCQRRPEACAAGSAFAIAFAERTREGAKILYDMIGTRLARPERPSGPERQDRPTTASGNAEPAPAKRTASQTTLTAADMAPPWRGPPPRHEAAAGQAS